MKQPYPLTGGPLNAPPVENKGFCEVTEGRYIATGRFRVAVRPPENDVWKPRWKWDAFLIGPLLLPLAIRPVLILIYREAAIPSYRRAPNCPAR